MHQKPKGYPYIGFRYDNLDSKEIKKKKNRNLFFSGVLVLTISNVLVKVIGMLFKVPIHDLIESEGMGYFNAAYSIYVWFYMISTAGLPVAVSMMISKSRAQGNLKETKRIYKITVTLFFIIGLIGMCLMMFGSQLFSKAIALEPAYLCIAAIAPTLFFICISSALRGYFQGFQYMTPTAISQVIESLGKLLLGILLAIYAINRGYNTPTIAAFAIAGLTIGSACSMLYLFVAKLLFREEKYTTEYADLTGDGTVTPTKKLLLSLVKIAIPITISASVMSLTNLIDTMIVIRRLKSFGLTEKLATTLYGDYTTLCVPMFNLPPTLIYPISYAIIPKISAARAAGDETSARNVIRSALKVTSLIALPAALGLSVMAKPVLALLYSEESVNRAAPWLSILALSVFFVCMLSITNAALQAYNQERKPIVSMLCGAAVKLVASYILIGIPSIGIYGTPIGTFLCYFAIIILNLYFMMKYVKVIPNFKQVLLYPFISAVICAGAAFLSYTLLSAVIRPKMATLLAICLAVFVYLIVICLTKAITKEDILLIPKGKKLYAVLQKIHLMK